MFKYSVELRAIKKVFDFEYDFYDEQFRCEFEDKFCDHYAFDEIGFESIERFKHSLKSHLNLNMPYWSQLYETELAAQDISFLLNKDLRETFIRTVDTKDNLIGKVSQDASVGLIKTSKNENNINLTTNDDGSTTNSTNNDNTVHSVNTVNTVNQGTSGDKRSDIADGVSSVSLERKYLTGVGANTSESTQDVKNTVDGTNNTSIEASGTAKNKRTESGTNTLTGEDKSEQKTESTSNNIEDKTGNLLEKTELISKGNIGVTSSAELLEKWRNVLINLDKEIILSCRDLFMGVY